MSLRARLAHPSVVPVHLSVQFDDLMAADGATRQDDFGTSRQVQDVAIQPGEDIAATTLWIVGDTTPEANERINAQVIDAPAARFLRHPAIVIANDDANTIWVDNSSASEGDTGMHPMPFTIHLSRPQPFPVRFNIATFDVDGLGYFNATAGQDYVPRASALTIPAGATSTTFNVQIIGDTAQEYYAEEFAVRIESVTQGAVLVDVAARGRIFDFTEGLP